jgi:hypothetical protein
MLLWCIAVSIARREKKEALVPLTKNSPVWPFYAGPEIQIKTALVPGHVDIGRLLLQRSLP